MTEMDSEPTFVDVVVTCRTDDCANSGEEITLSVPENVGAIGCGVCGQPIADIRST